MKNERILTPTTFALVAFLHIGLMALLWQGRPPQQVEMAHIEFVDLGDFGGGDGQAEGAGAPAPETAAPPKPKPEPAKPKETPKPQPKPAEPPKAELKPVITQKTQADIRQTKEQPQPKPVEKTKPEPVEKPVAKPVEKPVEKAAEKPAAAPVEKPAAESDKPAAAGPARAKDGTGDGSGYAKIQGKGSGSGSGEGRGTGRGEGSGSRSGDGHGEGGGSGAGSSRSNPVKASGSIPRPPYPPLSEENGEEGTVRLRVLVSPSGSVADVKVARGSGFARLDRAAAGAARSGSFNSGGKWVEYAVSVNFSLN
ncbi:hypothetical protein BWD09_01875 [Neisseria dentiae]|uniref:Protein TonB n=1 Tax=Neisseria dentiae TaxID=194197 RepID=A0A1X3DFN6_9NEIS|nr:energy transducer TonB [Neisseria dentiae]OSI18542.1 hypothetical protein BWD09_01875 [Neisseria dentiae]QMT45568.1 TonB family protein [Neisseria dentiae]STZ51484.1 TonB [Neisseria dentiae]